MNVVLLRVGIDTGCGGIHAPLFADGTFEYIPIPDTSGHDERTYGTVVDRHGRPLAGYFPRPRQARMAEHPIHVDPEFATFTYGDPGTPKSSLRNLAEGDLLVFYAGLRGWDFPCEPALYLIGYFEVQMAGKTISFTADEIQTHFAENFHVRHPQIFTHQRESLVLVKGTPNSRLLQHAVRISMEGRDRAGKPLHVLSAKMQKHFGDFNGRLSIQRSPPRWVTPDYVDRAATFVRSVGEISEKEVEHPILGLDDTFGDRDVDPAPATRPDGTLRATPGEMIRPAVRDGSGGAKEAHDALETAIRCQLPNISTL